ncbi:MAG TPA: protein translocase subunit SecD [Bryobacteraceae bacterium]|nr:protein translocase subunit SecD [Bryobacteraceae bacterium]
MNRLFKQTLLILAIVVVCLYSVVGLPWSPSVMRDHLRRNIRLGLDLRGGVSFILRVKVEDVPPAQRAGIVEQTRHVLDRRINAFGLSESSVQSYGSRGDELLVQLPDVNDPARIRRALESPTVLEWYAVQGGPYSSAEEARAQHGGVLPLGTQLFPVQPAGPGEPSRAWYLVSGLPVIRGADLRDARVSANDWSRPVTTFTLSQEAARRFEAYTQANIGKRAAIVLDRQVLSAPVIEDVIRDTGQIRGAGTLEEAQDLAANLRSGALPAGVEVLQERTVAPSLGADSIRHGVAASAAGLAAVVAAMLLYYRWAGANATLALVLNGVLLLAALSWFGAVLTLPGIAGVVLTIGMAVDSNVLIFERIREELRAGKSAAAAVAAGFTKAFGTLVDTHVTTVVSCAFLFLFGTPAVRGFAVTLVIGLVTNLFTAVFVSRVAFDWELARRRTPAQLSI